MAQADMKIGAIAPWFGGKRTLAPVIVRELGPHRAYWEPLGGGMPVILAKPECRQETVNDLHGDLINLARVIQSPELGPKLYRRLRRTLMHEAVLADAMAVVRRGDDADPLDRAWAFFVVCWTGRNGSAGTKGHARITTFCVRYTANGGDSATRFRGAVNSIAAWRRRLRNVTILNRDAFDVLARIADEPGTAIYCDPPYLEKGAEYEHDFACDPDSMWGDDHKRLADAVARFRHARVVVSYYAHPRLTDLYPGWTVVNCAMNKNMTATTGKVSTAPEVLLINGPSYATEAA